MKYEAGRIFDIRAYLDRLMRSQAHAFLIINIAHSEEFLQLTGHAGGVQIDFPMVTPRQRSLEGKIRAVASREGLELVENYGSEGTLFLDINLNAELAEVTATCSKVLRQVFNVSGDVELFFQHADLAAGDAT
jgi:hypothetical protein